MKTLHYRRHSLKGIGTQSNYISVEGLELAFKEGALCGIIHHRVFHGPLVRTAQTVLSFLQGRTGNSMIMPVIEEIGNDAIVAAIVNDAFKAAVKEGMTNYGATIMSHDAAEIAALAVKAMEGVHKMFDSMEDDETAIAFGHSPIIELAASASPCQPEGWDDLKEMDGLVFVEDENGVRVTEVIRAQREVATA